jgi:hypothetical protein
MPSTPPPPEPRSGLSLLDSSPLPEDVIQRNRTMQTEVLPKVASDPYEAVLEQAATWKLELEAVRDEVCWLQVQNCQSLDALCMAGAEIAD